MALTAQDALIHLMIVAASSDAAMTEQELERVASIVGEAPVFAGFDISTLSRIANQAVDTINGPTGIDGLLDAALAALPKRLEDTAYALCVEVAAVDLQLEQEELRLLEMIRDRLSLDRLTTAAIEVGARARYRKA
jgi:tellurite resistance protein